MYNVCKIILCYTFMIESPATDWPPGHPAKSYSYNFPFSIELLHRHITILTHALLVERDVRPPDHPAKSYSYVLS